MGSEMSSFADSAEFRAMLRNLASCEGYYTFCERLGLVPSSPDVDDREHQDAHARYVAVAPILEEVVWSSTLAGAVVHAVATGSCESREDLAMYVAIANASVAGAIIRLVDKGQLRVVAR